MEKTTIEEIKNVIENAVEEVKNLNEKLKESNVKVMTMEEAVGKVYAKTMCDLYANGKFDVDKGEIKSMCEKAYAEKLEEDFDKALEELDEDEDEDLYEGEEEDEDEELDEGDTDAINNYMTEMAYDDFLNDLDNEDYEPVGDLWDWWLDNFDLGSEAVYDGEYTQADVDAEGSLYGVAERAYINNKDFIDFDTDKAIATLTAKGLIRKVA